MHRHARWAILLGALGGCAEDRPAERMVPVVSSVEPVVAEERDPGGSGFVVARTLLENQQYAGWEAYVRRTRLLEGYADYLNDWIALPERVALMFAVCGGADAFYEPETRTITLCYELLDAFTQAFGELPEEEREQVVLGATDFIMYHEVGHALIDLLDLPTLGREEDAADQLAVYILTDGTDEGEQAAIDGAVALHRLEQETGGVALADEHSLGPQRFYNVICWVYGKNPDRHAGLRLRAGGVLPDARAERCPGEAAQLEASWNRLLEPYLKE